MKITINDDDDDDDDDDDIDDDDDDDDDDDKMMTMMKFSKAPPCYFETMPLYWGVLHLDKRSCSCDRNRHIARTWKDSITPVPQLPRIPLPSFLHLGKGSMRI
jgi:hypothetical protein